MSILQNKNECIPGRLYCCFIDDTDGSLVVYGADGKFYDADTLDEVSPDYDYLVEQTGAIYSDFAEH